MAEELKVTFCGEESAAWDAYVESSSDTTFSHLACWRRIICQVYGHPASYLMARRQESVVGVLPLVSVKSRLFGNVLSSMPYQDYGGISANDAIAARLLLEHALALKKKYGANCLELRHRRIPIENAGRRRDDKSALMLDLSEGAVALWKRISGKVRNQVRKAQKSGLFTRMGGAELLDAFYPVFAANMRDLGSPVHSAAFFTAVFAEFGENARLLAVYHDERMVGGLVCLFFKDSVVVPWASSLREYFPKCPNNLLYWDAIQHACDRGCKTFDFGRSSVNSGTYHFKLQWGAKPVQLNWQLFLDNGDKFQPPEMDAKYRLAAAIWKRLPVSWTVVLGPRLRRYLTQ